MRVLRPDTSLDLAEADRGDAYDLVDDMSKRTGRFYTVRALEPHQVLELLGLGDEELEDALDPKSECVFQAPEGYEGDTYPALVIEYDPEPDA